MKNKYLRLILFATLAVVLALCITACSPEQNDSGTNDIPPPKNNESNNVPLAETPLSGTLTISQCWSFLALDVAAERFMAIHPDVEIIVNDFDNDTERFNTQVRAQLMSGIADDIIDSSTFPYIELASRGLFVDIFPLMQNDPNFNEDDFFMNVFHGVKYRGRLYAFPINFGYALVGVNNMFSDELVERFRQYDVISNRQILDLYLDFPDNGGRFVGFNFDVVNIIAGSIREFIDFETNTANLNNDEFIKLLIDAKNGTNPQKAIDNLLGYTITSGFVTREDLVENIQRYLFFYTFAPNTLQVFFPHTEDEEFTHFIPLATDSGEIKTYTNQFLINAGSENIELAWEFLKFLVTDEAHANLFIGFNIPLKRENLRNLAPDFISRGIQLLRRTDFIIEGETEDIVDNIISTIENWSEMPMQAQHSLGSNLNEMIFETVTNFYNGILTAEQTAELLQNRVSLYLMERG
jgi:maltose-binding protein MalE